METLQNFLGSLSPIWYWGLGLILLFPVLILILNEVGYKVGRYDQEVQKPINTFKNFVLPLTALVVLLINILDFDRNALSIKVLETMIWVLVINAGIALVNRLLFAEANKSTWRGNVPQLFLDIFRVVLVLLGGAIVLSSVWNIELGGLVTALGLGSFVIGLALQDTLGNLFTGIALVYEKPFSVGQWIKFEDSFGEVIEMNWRAVRIRTREGELLVIPHLMIGQGMITNYSLPTRVHVIKQNVSFSYDNPPNRVKEALMQMCLNTPGVLRNPAPEVKTNEYGDSGIVYEIEFAIADFSEHEEITDELMTRIWYTAKRNHLSIPFPQMTLHRAESAPSVTETLEQMLADKLETLPQYLPIEKTNTAELLDGSKIEYFGRGELVFEQGDKTGSLYIILEGVVELFVKGHDGTSVRINSLSEGEFFGEVALLTSQTSSMSARVVEDVKLINVSATEVVDMVSRNPRLAQQLDEIMDNRRRTLDKYNQN